MGSIGAQGALEIRRSVDNSKDSIITDRILTTAPDMAGIHAKEALGPRRIVANSTATAMGSIGAQGAFGPKRIVTNPRDGTDRS